MSALLGGGPRKDRTTLKTLSSPIKEISLDFLISEEEG